MSELEKFVEQVRRNVARLRGDADLAAKSRDWIRDSSRLEYSYNFTWLGRPIIQYPQDVVALQEIEWSIRPDLIVETGVAHGGSLVFHASMLELIGGSGRVVGIDIDIREHNRREIEAHPMSRRIDLVEGSSTDPAVVADIYRLASGRETVLVLLDSNHTHDHVLRELELYSPLVRRGGYLVVFDTVIEDMPPDFFPDRPWGKGNNPKTAVREFLSRNDRFEVDLDIEAKLSITVAPEGYLRCIKD